MSVEVLQSSKGSLVDPEGTQRCSGKQKRVKFANKHSMSCVAKRRKAVRIITQRKTEGQNEDLQPIVQPIEIQSNQDLILRTTVDERGKTIIMKAAKSYNGFNDKITVKFPPYCVLGEEKIFLEVLPEDIVNSYNEKNSSGKKLLTPVLHLDRESGAPFLLNVTVSLPILPAAKEWIGSYIQCPDNMKISQNESIITVETNKFSPCAPTIIQNMMKILGLDDVFCLTYTEFGIYLLVEQFNKGTATEFKFDLRKFLDLQEHQKYRMDETKNLSLLLNPDKVLETDYAMAIKVLVEGPVRIQNINQDQRVHGNELTFLFPNPSHRIDDSNEITVQLEEPDPDVKYFELKLTYDSKNMRALARPKYSVQIPLLSRTEIDDLNGALIKDSDILVEFLRLIQKKWIKFLKEYLGLQIYRLREFILDDIKATIPAKKYNALTDVIRANVIMDCKNRKIGQIDGSLETIPSMMESIFRSFVTMDIERAKEEIFSILKASGAISERGNYPESLLQSNQEVLAKALMYIPLRRLKNSMSSFSDDEEIVMTEKLANFLLPDGDDLDSEFDEMVSD